MEWAEILRRRTKAFALAVVRFCRTLPHSVEADVFRWQLVKAGTSVGANYRSSCRGRTTREKRAKLGIALEEGDESAYWLEVLQELQLGAAAQRTTLLQESDELVRIFATSLSTHKSSGRS